MRITEKLRAKVRRWFLRHFSDVHLAEDATQQVFLKCLSARGSKDWSKSGENYVEAYVFRTAFSVMVDLIKRSNRESRVRRRLRKPGASSPSALGSEFRKQFDECLSSISRNQRKAWWLREIEGWSYASIAGFMKSPQNTVGSWICRVRTLLRDRLGHWIGE